MCGTCCCFTLCSENDRYGIIELEFLLICEIVFDFSGDTNTLVNGGPMPVIVKSTPQMEQMEQTTPAPKAFNSKEDRGKALRQVVAAFIANLGTINTGLVFGFSAVVIPQLKREDSLIPIDESQASWIGECKHLT